MRNKIALLLFLMASLCCTAEVGAMRIKKKQYKSWGIECHTYYESNARKCEIDKSCPLDSARINKEAKPRTEPSFEPGLPSAIIGIGAVALCSGFFSPWVTIVLGLIALVAAFLLLLWYKSVKKNNPFRSKNIFLKILLGFFFFAIVLALFAMVIAAFAVVIALLLAGILSAFVNPVVVALSIVGIGVVWLLASIVVYYIRSKRYKNSLK